MEHFSKDHKTIPINKRILIAIECKEVSLFDFEAKSMETETTAWSEFSNGGKPIPKQMLGSVEKKKSKRAGLWESQSEIQGEKLTIWVRLLETEKCNRAHQFYPFHKSKLASLYDGC